MVNDVELFRILLLTFGKEMLKFPTLIVEFLFLLSILSGFGCHVCSSVVWCIHISDLLFLFFVFGGFFDPSNLM